MNGAELASTPSRPGVAAFDFDGTLAQRDTFVPFLVKAVGWPRLAVAALQVAPWHRSRDRLKVALVGQVFRGWAADRLDQLARDYATTTLPPLLRPELVERIGWHQAEGHAVVLVSAGLGAYLRPVAQRLGLDDVLAVELTADATGTLTGIVTGGTNNRGPEKVARLHAWIAERFGPGTAVELWAYGDSSGDEELLAAADHATWVGRRVTPSRR